MKVTVIPPDKFISVDGEGRHFDFSADPTIEAIQWDGDSMVGHVQRRNGADPFTDPRVVQPFVDAWRAEKDRIAALPVPPPAPPRLVLAREIVAGWTAEDLVLIEALAKDSAPARLFLKQLEVRGEKPIDLDSASFRDAWALMTQALGASRTAAMMTALRAIAR